MASENTPLVFVVRASVPSARTKSLDHSLFESSAFHVRVLAPTNTLKTYSQSVLQSSHGADGVTAYATSDDFLETIAASGNRHVIVAGESHDQFKSSSFSTFFVNEFFIFFEPPFFFFFGFSS